MRVLNLSAQIKFFQPLSKAGDFFLCYFKSITPGTENLLMNARFISHLRNWYQILNIVISISKGSLETVITVWMWVFSSFPSAPRSIELLPVPLQYMSCKSKYQYRLCMHSCLLLSYYAVWARGGKKRRELYLPIFQSAFLTAFLNTLYYCICAGGCGWGGDSSIQNQCSTFPFHVERQPQWNLARRCPCNSRNLRTGLGYNNCPSPT